MLRACILLFYLILSIKANAQFPYMKHYTSADGLPSNTINDMLQDDDDFMWFATDCGVSRFDGHQYVNFTESDGLADNEVVRLGKDHESRIWFLGFNGKASFYFKGKFYNELNSPVAAQTKLNSVFTKFLVSKSGLVYLISNTDGFIQVNGDSVRKFSRRSLKQQFGIDCVNGTRSVKIDAADNLWIVTLDSAFIFKNGLMTSASMKTQGVSSSFVYSTFLSDGSFVLPRDNLLVRVHGKQTDSVIIPGLHPLSEYVSIEEDHAGNLWLMMQTGAYLFREKKFDDEHRIKLFEGKYSGHVFLDSEGNTWLAPLRDGVYLIPSLDGEFINVNNGLANNNVLCFAEHPEGALVGFANGAVQLIQCNSSYLLANKPVQVGSYMVKIFQAENNNWLFLTNSEIISADSKFRILERQIANWGKSYYLEEGGSLLIGGGFDLSRWHKEKIELLYRFPSENRIYSIAKSNDSSIWLGTEEGVYIFENSEMKFVGHQFPLLKGRINDLQCDKDGRMWIATSKNGLLVRQNKILKQVSDGKESLSVRQIFQSEDGTVYAGTDHGILIVKRISENKFEMSRIRKSDGLASEKINTLLVKNNAIWIGTDEGLQIFSLTRRLNAIQPIPIRLVAFTVNGKNLLKDSCLSLAHNENNIHLSFSGICFRDAPEVKYRYKFHASDTTWLYTSNSSLDLPDLSSSEYQIMIQAGAGADNWSDQPLQISFMIRSPFWQAWWFYFISGSTVAACIFFITRIQFRRRIERSEERRHLAETELAALRSQMNPHFIFNSLNAIQDFIFQHKSEEANEYLTKFSKLIRLILAQSRMQVVNLEEEIELLSYYLQLESLRFENKFKWKIDVAEGLNIRNMFIPPLLLQPIAENSINHGFKELNKPGLLNIRISQFNSSLHCEIEDNGKGRKASADKRQDRSSLALKILEERIHAFNRIATNAVAMNVEDLKDEEGMASGTRTIFTFHTTAFESL